MQCSIHVAAHSLDNLTVNEFLPCSVVKRDMCYENVAQDIKMCFAILMSFYSKLENVAIAMHCNVRSLDGAPVVLRFSYDTHTNVGVDRSTYPLLTADTLRYAVTLTFDLLTLNVCS